jgi:aminoglycoside phosphotransferase family enzyme/predicted kinase
MRDDIVAEGLAPAAPAESARQDDQARLIAALRDPALYGRDCRSVQVLETHISWVLLTGRHAYKIKKAIDLGFLDFTTLERRHHYCEQELRLNRRTAPALYLDVVPITGSPGRPRIGGSGEAIEWAVRMREFPQSALLSEMLSRDELAADHVDRLAAVVAEFHARATRVDPDSPIGAPDDARDLALDNFKVLRPLLEGDADRADCDRLAQWTRAEHARRCGAFAARHRDGFVRECHGDLHLRNIALIDGEVTLFDCIEFNERIRHVDVTAEIAFAAMDLASRGRPDFGWRFLNGYFEITGDYASVAVLRYYLVYRAMVRAKVAGLRATQARAGDAAARSWSECRRYLGLASEFADTAHPAIAVTHGFSGCGKTTLSQALVAHIGALRVRTDVERKRLLAPAGSTAASAGIDTGIYGPDATRRTYERVAELAREVAAAGYPALADGTFLQRWQRDVFRTLAADLSVPFVIVAFGARESTLRARIAARAATGRDASDADAAVLGHQLRTAQPFAPAELAFVATYDAEQPLATAARPQAWRNVLSRLGLRRPDGAALAAEDRGPGDAAFAEKVAFLAQPHAYPEPAVQVATIETHMSWVFLTERSAYKLKKPVRTRWLDLRGEPSRRRNCFDEVSLNRRFSSNVYVGTIPLTRAADGRLQFGPDGEVVDWLVVMRRLPAELMLDRRIASASVRRDEIRAVVGALCRHYCRAPPAAITAAAYRGSLAADIAATATDLAREEFGLSAARIDALRTRQLAVLEREPAMFDARVAAGRVIEAHGDLRPEHICLESPPQIIDCLEFSRELRTQDAADELAFLALECERLGAAELRACIFADYAEASGDAPPERLVDFYQSYRAAIRAKIAVLHLLDPALRGVPKWRAQADDYLRLGLLHVERCG